MDLVIEIIVWVIVAPILEIILTAIFGVIAARWKWHPLKNKFDKTVMDATDNIFVMMADSDTKAAQVVGLTFAIFGYVLGIVLSVMVYFSKLAKLSDSIIIAIMFQALILPMLISSLHYTTKKIYFSETEIVVKSFVYCKKFQIEQIYEVTETNYAPAMLMLLIEFNNEKKLKIKQNFSNYELAKKRLLKYD